ncbi:flagellar hook-length control protein FliK [Campylobacter sp.]|uniref:flagellar hook-length control protein FliK n=1 Tax=Campylobacter sp. TaxID=205 RepID=UPI0025C2C059|nr:flagellar hook-length control protein FliK [Campylobacter sp.]
MSNIQSAEALNVLSLAPKNENIPKDTDKSDGDEFLKSLIQAIDEKDSSLSKDYKTPEKKYNTKKEAIPSSEQKKLDEKDSIKLFENASLMQILSLLEILQSDSKDIKLNKLAKDNIAILSIENNIHKLKSIKNINELLNIAKDLGLNVKSIKFEQIQDLKKSFPKLDKKKFFDTQKQSNTNIFQDLVNQKISNYLKEESEQKKHISKNKDNDSASLLACALKNIDLSKKVVEGNENDKKIILKDHLDDKILVNEKDNKSNINNILKSNKNSNNTNKNSNNTKLNDIEMINTTHNFKKELEQSKEKIDPMMTNNLENFEKKVSSILENLKPENPKNDKKENTNNIKSQNIRENKLNLENLLNTQDTIIKNQKNEQSTEVFSDFLKNVKENTKESNESPQENLNSFVKEMNKVSNHFVKNQSIHIKETFNDFAQEFKEKIESYKAPITRFNITLNPNNLGEVEVTLIQRGTNLNISFNSNQNTLNLFIQHQAEFKNSLVNMGFTNLEMNFSEQERKDQNNQQKQNKNKKETKVNLENEIQERPSLEMVLAKYF